MRCLETPRRACLPHLLNLPNLAHCRGTSTNRRVEVDAAEVAAEQHAGRMRVVRAQDAHAVFEDTAQSVSTSPSE